MNDTSEGSGLLELASTVWNRYGGARPIQISVELSDAFRHHRNGDPEMARHTLRSCTGCMYTHDMRLHTGFGLDLIEAEMRHHNLIAVFVDLLDYCIAEGPLVPNEPQAHACLLLLARHAGKWFAYYFNPHGSIAWSDQLYELYHTRTRLISVPLPTSIDAWVMTAIISCLNEQAPGHVKYSTDHRHNYRGANLQKDDHLGICYTYPVFIQLQLAASLTEEEACRYLTSGRGGLLVRAVKRALAQGKASVTAHRAASVFLYLVRKELGCRMERSRQP